MNQKAARFNKFIRELEKLKEKLEEVEEEQKREIGGFK